MSGVNKVIIIGNLGRDPELRHTANGTSVANFSVATSERFKRANGEFEERVEWHNISVWGNLAELCEKYLRKGSKVYVEGRIQTDEFEKDGEKRKFTKIIGQTVQFLDPKKQAAGSGSSAGYDSGPSNDDEIPF